MNTEIPHPDIRRYGVRRSQRLWNKSRMGQHRHYAIQQWIQDAMMDKDDWLPQESDLRFWSLFASNERRWIREIRSLRKLWHGK